LKAGLTVIRFLPPYVTTQEDIEFAVNTLKEVLS